jgi:DNA repair exonuclease SbcCD ATPase subunit
MKITSFAVENILGARAASLQLPTTGVALVAGGNAEGKSSVAEALRLALLGWSDRAGPKKSWQELVTDGARVGRVTVMTDTGPIKLTLPSGEISGVAALPASAELCLGKQRITAVKKSERAALLKELVGTEGDADEIVRRLLARKHAAGFLDRIAPLLRSSLDTARDEATGMAREAKGVWRSITNQNWGSKQAETWEPEGEPAHPASTPWRTRQDELRAHLKAAQNKSAAIDRELARAQPTHPDDLAVLKARAASFATAEDRRQKADTMVRETEERLAALQTELRSHGPETHSCPHCDGLLHIENGAIVAAGDLPAVRRSAEELRSLIDDAELSLVTYRGERNAAACDVEKADAAARRLQAEKEVSGVDVAALEADAAAARRTCEEVQRDLAALHDAEAWHSQNRRARDAHEAVLAWTALADDLGPEGVAADLAGGAISAVNKDAEIVCDQLGLDLVSIDADGAARYAGRESWYCSESERWRIDTAIAIALARLSGLGMVLLDRLDVIEPDLRPPLLSGLTRLGLGTAIVCCTVAKRPTLPTTIGLLWMGDSGQQAVAA